MRMKDRRRRQLSSALVILVLLWTSLFPGFGTSVWADEFDDYITVDYTDFGDSGPLQPAYWGFVPFASTLVIHTGDVGGNTTAKLQYNIIDQSGGRIATKELASAVGGLKIRFAFDWYPGDVNDRGNNPFENGGEVKFLDSTGNVVFSLNNTNNSNLAYYAGNQPLSYTGFSNPEE